MSAAPRPRPPRKAAAAPAVPSPPAVLPLAGGGLATMASLAPESLEWMIRGLVPRNELVLLAGPSEVGKSTFLARIIAHVTSGGQFDQKDNSTVANVLVYPLEEAAGGAPRERVLAAGGHLHRVAVGTELPGGGMAALPFLPDALSQLRQRIVDTRAALVVIDPLTSLLARGVSPLDGQDVRSVVCPLQALARELGIVVLITLNNRKSTGGPASDWVSGSKEWWNVPRHILCMARDPKRPNHGIIAVGKQSRGGRRPSLSVRFDQENGVDQMVIVGDSDATARDLGREPEDDLGRSARELAQAYLRRCLDDGDERASRLLSESEAAGFSRHTLDRAAHDMGVRREFRSANGERAWWWCRPENWPK